MRKLTLLAAAFLFLFINVPAQERLVTLDDIFSPEMSRRVPFGGGPTRLTWAPDGRSFKQMQGGRLVRVNAITGEAEPYFDSARFASASSLPPDLIEPWRKAFSFDHIAVQQGETAILLNHANDLWHYDITSGKMKRLTTQRA